MQDNEMKEKQAEQEAAEAKAAEQETAEAAEAGKIPDLPGGRTVCGVSEPRMQ